MFINLCMLWVALAKLFVCFTTAELTDVLDNFEYLDFSDLTITNAHRVARSASRYAPQDIQFSALGRSFHLVVQPTRGLFSSDFRAYAIGADGVTKEPITIDPYFMLSGFERDDPDSMVQAYWENNRTLHASIYTGHDLFMVEPSSRFRNGFANSGGNMIIYREADLKNSTASINNQLYDNYVEETSPPLTEDEERKLFGDKPINRRSRRQSADDSPGVTEKNVCKLYLVADHLFTTQYGTLSANPKESAARYMAGVISRVNTIYQNTVFSTGEEKKDSSSTEQKRDYRQLGFQIGQIIVHEAPTRFSSDPLYSYNEDRGKWEPKDLLEEFSRNAMVLRQYCLGHLFTYQTFEGSVLGLAYIASPQSGQVGGICSRPFNRDGFTLSPNSGWSSSMNSQTRQPMVSMQADLVTAHELGHNWGSHHDGAEPDCSPTDRHAGKFIMNQYAVPGNLPNNKLFSQCSRRTIYLVLDRKLGGCFSDREDASKHQASQSVCGNFIMEAGEQCDAGPHEGTDLCCTSDCKLKPQAVCSDRNEICCERCQYASATRTCRHTGDLNTGCVEDSHCSGTSLACGEGLPKPDGTDCVERGRCRNGTCITFCESHGMEPCYCPIAKDLCYFCCINHNGKCELLLDNSGQKVAYEPGAPCGQGICTLELVCQKTVQDLGERLWSIIQNLTSSAIVKFMRDNIVGVVLILSVPLWIAGSCIVSRIDKKRAKLWKAQAKEPVDRPNEIAMTQMARANPAPVVHRRLPSDTIHPVADT